MNKTPPNIAEIAMVMKIASSQSFGTLSSLWCCLRFTSSPRGSLLRFIIFLQPVNQIIKSQGHALADEQCVSLESFLVKHGVLSLYYVI